MKENIVFKTDSERKMASDDDINFFDDLAKKFEQNGYKERYQLELKRQAGSFIIKIGQKVIYLPEWHSITIKKDKTKSEVKIEDQIMQILKEHDINV